MTSLQWDSASGNNCLQLPSTETERGLLSQWVSAAETNSPLYLGQVASTNFTLFSLAPGTYYWRVDAVTAFGIMRGDIHSFLVSTLYPSVAQISEMTFPNRPVTVSLALTSSVAGETWQAVPSAAWISVIQSTGVTPATLQITLDPSGVAPLVRTGAITISGLSGPLFTIPVRLTVEALRLTILKADPTSDKVYGISEDTATSPTRAYLLEINTTTETMERIVHVGSSVTDLAIHPGENRLYIPNWQTGTLLAINLLADDFDPDLDRSLWANITGGVATNGGQGFRGNQALYFAANGERHALTIPLDVSAGGTIAFLIRAGNEAADGNTLWNNSETGETVALEYTKDQGATWTSIQSLNTIYPALSNWTGVSVAIPAGACSTSTQFRWRQAANSGATFDCWALDDMVIQGATPPPPDPVSFVTSSANSSTSIALFWTSSQRAVAYVVERKTASEPWAPVATTPGSATSYTDLNLTPGTGYDYRIQAANSGGAAAYSPTTTSLTWSYMQQWIAENYGSPDALSSEEMTTAKSGACAPILRVHSPGTAKEPVLEGGASDRIRRQ